MLNILKRHPLALGLFFLPSSLLVGVMIIYPLINGVILSFTDATPINKEQNWVGIENYVYLLEDSLIWEVLWNSILMIGVSIAASIVIGFAIALMLNSGIRGVNLFRTGVFQIWVVPWMSVAVLWGWIFNSDYGILNYILEVIGLVDEPVNWLNRPGTAQATIIIAFTWRMIPFMMVISVAAIQSIPRDLMDAAAIDGAGFGRQLIYLTLPLVRNVLVIVGLLQSFRLFQEITLPWVLTEGGPVNATTTLSLLTYKIAFEQWDFGLASTAGTLWLLFLLVFSVFYLRIFIIKR